MPREAPRENRVTKNDFEKFFDLAMDSSPAAMVVVSNQGRITLMNKEAERLFGYTREGLVGKEIEALAPSGSRAAHRDYRGKYLQNPEARPMGVDRNLLAVRKDGSEFPIEVVLNPIRLDGETFVLCSVVDLTDQKKADEQLRKMSLELDELKSQLSQLASVDRLTGLKNRRTFDEEFDLQIQLMGRMAGILSLLLIDVDNFKGYNDQYGHQAGDEALKAVGRILSQNSRTTDVVARFGGEEFAILLPDTAELGVIRLGERFRGAIHDHTWDKRRLTISVGASTVSFEEGVITRDVDFRTRLLSEAGRALDHAKRGGRDRVTHIFDVERSER
jgi:diguanylate cyclase (GGDEF)-like protein/PAS domain S-box-containing protein